MSARHGMTLVEILVAILIFTVVSLAMMGILLAGTDLFRQGEYGRSTTDTAVVALAALEDDLDRVVPEADGGLIRARVLDNSGNCEIAFKIERRDPLKVDTRGYGRRRIVAWRARTDNGKEILERVEVPSWDSVDPTAPLPGAALNDPFPDPDPTDLNAPQWTPVTEGCLHFGAWLDGTLGSPRERAGTIDDWTRDVDAHLVPPLRGGGDFVAPTTADAFPTTVRIVIALTGGGRFAPVGTLVRDAASDESQLRIAGVKGLSTLPGSMLRVGDEWIAYTGYLGGVVDCSAGPLGGRGVLRSVAAAHTRGEAVRLAQFYTLVRPLAR